MGLARYFTTPIYYANGQAHAGHVYATVLAGILKRHYTGLGAKVRFLTGLDEHGEAVADKALEMSCSPQELVDAMAAQWQGEFARFDIDYDVFLRTTSAEHRKTVQAALTFCHNKGDIYFGEHVGFYCVKCEGFLNASERDELNNCLIHKRPTEERREQNYFFKTSRYKEQLRALITNGAIVPHQPRYAHELLGLLDALEGDLSISRPKSRMAWGIELPFDNNHVAYVWFDALTNYLTGIGGLEAARTSELWKNVYHILGKDILKFHGIFWPAMCLSLEIPVPKLLLTGWLLKDGHKMSKSLGNVVTPDAILNHGLDMFTNYVFRAVNPGEDIDIVGKGYFERYNADLANGLGNLASRLFTMVEKYTPGVLPFLNGSLCTPEEKNLLEQFEHLTHQQETQFEKFLLADALHTLSQAVTCVDQYITEKKPWSLAKENRTDELSHTLSFALALLRTVGFLGYAFFPKKMIELLSLYGENPTEPGSRTKACAWQHLWPQGFAYNGPVPKLYGRVDVTTAAL